MTGACALILFVAPAAAQSQPEADPGAQHHLIGAKHRHHLIGAKHRHHLIKTMKRNTQVIRFFHRHRWLLSDPRFKRTAHRQLALHTRSLATMRRKLARARAALRQRRQARHLAAFRAASPREVICSVFGRHCAQALAVARCESGLQTTAQNGQYLGLFQMGSSERRLFGHGLSARDQVKAAHRYFVYSGGDWSPWSCKPWS
jgi:hypothetical protein